MSFMCFYTTTKILWSYIGKNIVIELFPVTLIHCLSQISVDICKFFQFLSVQKLKIHCQRIRKPLSELAPLSLRFVRPAWNMYKSVKDRKKDTPKKNLYIRTIFIKTRMTPTLDQPRRACSSCQLLILHICHMGCS